MAELDTLEHHPDKVRYHTDPTYFPDGGPRAWLQVVGGFFLFFVTWGITTSFGVFQTYFKQVLIPGTSTFQLGWINSVQTSFIFFGGVLTGRLFDAGYFYHLVITGTVISFVCFMLCAECTEYYQIVLAQGVGLGLGMGIMFGPTVACYSSYFKLRRGMVMSITASGGGFGGVIFPIAANNLLSQVGYKWAIRILAFIDLFGLLIILLTVRDRLTLDTRKHHQTKHKANSIFALTSWIDPTALKDPVFMFFIIGISSSFLGLYAPIAFLQSFAININASTTVSTYIIPILSAMGFIGRLSTFLLAKYVGALNTTVIATMASAICIYSWQTITTESSLIVFTLFYGYFSGVVGTFPPFIIPHLTHDVTRLGVRFGMAFLCLGIFVLISIPIAGLVLVTSSNTSGQTPRYDHLSIFCGSALMAGSVLLACSRYFQSGFSLART